MSIMNSSPCFHFSSSQYGSITCSTFDSKYQQVICGTDLGIILWFHYDRSEIFHHQFLIEKSSCSIHKIECHEENGMLLVHYSIIIDKNSLNEEPLSNVVQLYSCSFSALGSKLNIRDEATQFKVTGGPKLNFALKEKSSYFEKKETGELIHCTRRIPLQNLQNSNFCIVWNCSEKENEFSIYRKLGRTFLRLTLGTTFNLRGEECDSMIFMENNLILRFRNVYVVYDYESKTILEEIVLEGDENDSGNGKKEIQIVAKLVSNIGKNDITWKGYYFQKISICQPRLIACISLDGKILTFYNIRNENIVELFQELTIEGIMSQNNDLYKLRQAKFSTIQETVQGMFVIVEGLCQDMSTIQIVMKFTHPNINIPMKKDDFKLQKAFELIAEEKIRQAFNLLLDFEIDASDSLDFGFDSRELMLLHENHHIVLRKDLVHSKYSSNLFNKDGSAKNQFQNEDENDEENEGQYFGVLLKRFLILRRNNLRNLPQDFISIHERISIDNFIFLAHLTSGDIRKALQFVKEMDGIVYCSFLECNKVLEGGEIIGRLLSKDYIALFKALLLQTYYNKSIHNLRKSFTLYRECLESTQDENDIESIENSFKKMFQQESRQYCNLEMLKEIYWKTINGWLLEMNYLSSIRSMISNITVLGIDQVFRYITNLSQSYTVEIIEKLINDMKQEEITTSEIAIQYFLLLSLRFSQSEHVRGITGRKVTKSDIIHGIEYLEHFVRIKTNCPALQLFIHILMKEEFLILNMEMKENVTLKEMTQRNIMFLQKFTSWNNVPLETIKELLEFDGNVLEFLTSFKDDEILVSIAVKSRGLALKYASERLRNNLTVVELAISQNYYAFEYISAQLKGDRKLVLECVTKFGLLLEIVPNQFKEDSEVVQAAVSNPLAIQFASEKFKYDKRIIKPLIELNGEVLKFCSNSIRNDSELILTSTNTFGLAILYSSDSKKLDTELIIKCMRINKLFANKKILEYILNTKQLTEDMPLLLQAYQHVKDERIEEIVRGWTLKSVLPHLSLAYNFKCRTLYWIIISKVDKERLELEKYASASISKSITRILIYDHICKKSNRSKEDLELVQKGGQVGKYTYHWIYDIMKIIDEVTLKYASDLDKVFNRYINQLQITFEGGKFFERNKVYDGSLVTVYAFLLRISYFIKEGGIVDHVRFNQEIPVDDAEFYLLSNYLNQFAKHGEGVFYPMFKESVMRLSAKLRLEVFKESTIVAFITKWVSSSDFPSFNSILNVIESSPNSDPDMKYVHLLLQKFPHLILISKIGRGAQGIVFKCFHTQLEQIVVLKVNIVAEEQPERVEKLFTFMKTPNLKGIVQTFECNFYELHQNKYSYIIMEIGTPLDQIISEMHENYSNLDHCLSNQDLIEILQYFTQVLEGVISLHNHNFTHRDLKLANIIINNEGHAKLIDFDNSKVIQSNHSITVNVGTWEYLAPEVYDEEEDKQAENFKISKNCDTYSMGCVLMKMICNKTLSILSTTTNDESYGSLASCLFGVGRNYFFKLLSTPQGEAMLHQAIRKEVDKFIDPSLEVFCSSNSSYLEKVQFNDIIGRCLITMIQSRSTHRGECIHYLKIMNNLIEILRDPSRHFTHTDLLKGLLTLKSSTMDALKFENQSIRAQMLKYEQTLREIYNISKFIDPSQMVEQLENIHETCKNALHN